MTEPWLSASSEQGRVALLLAANAACDGMGWDGMGWDGMGCI